MANKKISELPYIDSGKLSGNTLIPLVTYYSATTGDTVHTYTSDFQSYILSGQTITGGTYSAGTISLINNSGGTLNITGLTTSFSGGSGNCITDLYVDNLHGCTTGITIYNDLIPNTDNTNYLGIPLKRFREINTVSGTTTLWSATTRVYTPEVDLGLDGLGNSRVITANNSIIQNDVLNGGTF